MTKTTQLKFETIYTYTSEQAAEDGDLFAIETVNKMWAKRGLFNYITTNLMNQGYLNKDGSVNMPNLVDLLNQAVGIVKAAGRQDWFFSGKIELPNGCKQEIFITQNNTGRFTLMLPEDY